MDASRASSLSYSDPALTTETGHGTGSARTSTDTIHRAIAEALHLPLSDSHASPQLLGPDGASKENLSPNRCTGAAPPEPEVSIRPRSCLNL